MLLTLTLLLVLFYIACTNRTIHSSVLSFRMAHQMTFLGTRSNAFTRSTNAKYNFLFLARCFSCNCRSMNIASVVPRPGMKPNCMYSIEILSLMIFFITLDSFHDMIKEFDTSVVTSLQSITFPFVNVDDEAIFPIRWNDTISYHVIGNVSDQPCTSITRRLQHFRYYSRGTSSFLPVFILVIAFITILTSICMVVPTTGSAVRSSGFQENTSFRSRS